MVKKGDDLKMGNIDDYLTGYLLDVENDDVTYSVEFPNNLREFKTRLNANCIDTTYVRIGAREYVIIHKDNMANGHVSVANKKGDPIMRGNVIVFGVEGCKGGVQLKSLDEEDIRSLKQRTGLMHVACPNGTTYNTYMLCDVEEI